jgi:hypothetical protein
MGIKFAREYEDIITDLTKAIMNIDNFYNIFDMNGDDWSNITTEEKFEYAKTLADDLFFGLGNDPEFEIGNTTLLYNKDIHAISFYRNSELITSISLI